MSPDNDLEREILQLEQRYAENAHGLVFAHLADAYRRAGEFSKAEGLLLHGLKSHPSYTSAYNVLGRVYLDSERYEDAQAQFSRVLELDPHNLISLRALGDIAAQRGHLADAREWYERMLQIDPRSEEARDGLAKLTSSPEGPPAPEAAAGDAPPLSREPETIGFEEPDSHFESVASEPAPEANRIHEPPTAEAEDKDLETVEKIRAEVEPIEGLMGGMGIDAASTDDDSADFVEEDVLAFGEEEDLEPWAVDEPYPPHGAPQDAVDSEVRPEPDLSEPWLDSVEQVDQEPAEHTEEPAGEEEAEPWLTAETESLELRSMDDWSPGFVVGELLEGHAAEELRPEEILEGLDAEYMFGTAEEPTVQPEASGFAEEERAGEGVVTETMAELYASQGLYADAIAVYQQLAEANPDDERLRSRIFELERRVEELAESVPDEDELVRLMRLTEADEEARPEAAAVDESASEIEAEVFGFEDDVPVAGFDQLDPFAASFDTLSAKSQSPDSILDEAPRVAEPAASGQETEPGGPVGPGEPLESEPVPIESLESEPVPIESLESEPVPVESLAEEPAAEESPGSIEGDDAGFVVLGQTVDESSADAVTEEESEETAYTQVDEGITAVDSIWELTEVGASEVREGADQPVEDLAAESEEVDVPVRIDGGNEVPKPDVSSTIEDYVNALLSFDVESLFTASQSSAGSQEDEAPSRRESSSSEDLEQFQEWLKSLKR